VNVNDAMISLRAQLALAEVQHVDLKYHARRTYYVATSIFPV